ncbi:MAG TPA: ABC transporter substrate-binding protein [candidate division Zixibacteria bacterium]|nr:ABC transporter substrate-binding protein [candidate division Zixibacteria bacterium]
MANPVRIEAGFATIGQGAGPLMVTWKAGLFEKHGLEVPRPRLMGGARAVVRGLMTGEIQFGNLAAPAALRANLAGDADLVFLTGGINQQFLMGRPGIDSRTQLAGKTIGFVGDGGLNDVLVRFVIEKLSAAGIAPVDTRTIPAGSRASLEAVVAGHCDAAVITPPEALEAKRRGCRFLVDFAEYGLNYALGGIAARRATVEQHPEIVARFVRAYVEGMHRYRTDRPFTVAVQAEYSALSDRTIAEETYDLTRPGMPAVPYPSVPALQTVLDFIARELPGAIGADVRKFVDDRFIRELERHGFVASLDRSEA